LALLAEAGQLLQRFLGFEPQAAQLSNHELHDIIGVPLRVNALEVPGPSCLFVIEHEQTFFGERVKKLIRKNGCRRFSRGPNCAKAGRGARGRNEALIGNELAPHLHGERC